MTGQEKTLLLRAVRRLVEAASVEALEDARVVLEGYAVDRDVPIVLFHGPQLTSVEILSHEPRTPDGCVPTPARLAFLRRAVENQWAINATHEEMRLAGIKGYGEPEAVEQDHVGASPETIEAVLARNVPPPTLAELAAARPRVTIPGRYCGDGHGVRIGRLVEDLDGMAQVQVDGFGVVNVPSIEVER